MRPGSRGFAGPLVSTWILKRGAARLRGSRCLGSPGVIWDPRGCVRAWGFVRRSPPGAPGEPPGACGLGGCTFFLHLRSEEPRNPADLLGIRGPGNGMNVRTGTSLHIHPCRTDPLRRGIVEISTIPHRLTQEECATPPTPPATRPPAPPPQVLTRSIGPLGTDRLRRQEGVNSARGRPRSERRCRDGRVGSACGRRDVGQVLRTHARTAARTASERVARPSASALAISAARVASSSRTGTTVPRSALTGGRPRRALGSLDRS